MRLFPVTAEGSRALSFLDRVRACAVFSPERYRPFRIGGRRVGLVENELAEILTSFPHALTVSSDGVELSPEAGSFAERTRLLDGVLRDLAARGIFPGWREEAYEVIAEVGGRPLMAMERTAVPRFGVIGTGIHVNGYVEDGNGIRMWIGRRSLNRPTSPGKLDQLVAGGKSEGHSVRQTLIKEAAEEASIPLELASQARAVGTLAYRTEREDGLRRDLVYVFDLKLPADFVPVNTDGEIESFELWPLEQVIARVRDTDDFKFNCALVVIDFLVRRGLLDPDDEDYAPIVAGLHSQRI
jgi:8-oxo-dGTP pyrophosphatase MutT (NUDIX family)